MFARNIENWVLREVQKDFLVSRDAILDINEVISPIFQAVRISESNFVNIFLRSGECDIQKMVCMLFSVLLVGVLDIEIDWKKEENRAKIDSSKACSIIHMEIKWPKMEHTGHNAVRTIEDALM